MENILNLKNIRPTVFLKEEENAIKQLIEITIVCRHGHLNVAITVNTEKGTEEIPIGSIPEGESMHEIFIDEILQESMVVFALKSENILYDQKDVSWLPPKHWGIHVVQISHHDPGFTDLPSNVLQLHDRWIEAALAFADETDQFPDDAKFRIVIEQAWSAVHFLQNANPEKVSKLLELIHEGRIEITALFGNMVTEICNHETMIRALYHSFQLKREFDIPLISAEHNDVTGISWGLCTALTDAGIKIFCPAIPPYYKCGDTKDDLQSYWDEDALFPQGGEGTFWWESQSGKKILFWHNNTDWIGDFRTDMPDLTEHLDRLIKKGYPYSVLRWPVLGGLIDNSPYVSGYAYKIREWNEKWAYPHLICSTDAKFYEKIIREIPEDLPVHRGELCGQDYPVGATSNAAATALNRNNHMNFSTAEKLATAASLCTDYHYPKKKIRQSVEEILWYDEHAWGHHFPCGPAMEATEYEKAVHAYRAAALIHDITNKAMGQIADNISFQDTDHHLVVFNSTSWEKTGPIRVQFREMDNCGTIMMEVLPEDDPKGCGFSKGVVLQNRQHINLPNKIIEGGFELIDDLSGDIIPYQLIELQSAYDNVPYAAERLGAGTGKERYTFNGNPIGLKRDICFIVKDVPALGYKSYKIQPIETPPLFDSHLKSNDYTIENTFYRISVDEKTGSITSIFDKDTRREIVDSECPHGFNSIIVRRYDENREFHLEQVKVQRIVEGPVCVTLETSGSVHGHPIVKQTVSLYEGIKEIYFSTKILKDATPLLDAHLAFPFRIEKPEFRYEGTLSVMNPIKDYFEGSYSDTIAVQNWVKTANKKFSILWSSLDAPVVGLSGLWPGYVSPAHRCLTGEQSSHAPLKVEELRKAWIYSNILNNNFGTNFSISQTGDLFFRYVITSREGVVSDKAASIFGNQAMTKFENLFCVGNNKGNLKNQDSFIKVDGQDVELMTFKKAENDDGYILRLWNRSNEPAMVKIEFSHMDVKSVRLTNNVEEDQETIDDFSIKGFALPLSGSSVATVRVATGQ